MEQSSIFFPFVSVCLVLSCSLLEGNKKNLLRKKKKKKSKRGTLVDMSFRIVVSKDGYICIIGMVEIC
jgi:hypothetical protein